jgi:hypothetical protein
MTREEVIRQLEEIIALGRSGFIGEKDIEVLQVAVGFLRDDEAMEPCWVYW